MREKVTIHFIFAHQNEFYWCQQALRDERSFIVVVWGFNIA
jgi:hypothetical protein